MSLLQKNPVGCAFRRPIAVPTVARRRISRHICKAVTTELAVDAPQSRHVQFVKLPEKKGFYTVEGRMELEASPETVWRVLTAYDRCADVFNNILTSEIETSTDGGLHVIQTCSWSFLAFSGTFIARMAVDEDAVNKQLVFSLVHSSFMKDFEGRWQVSPASSSGSQGPRCLVEHRLSVKPSLPVPPPISYYTRSIFVQQVDAILQDLEREVNRVAQEQQVQITLHG